MLPERIKFQDAYRGDTYTFPLIELYDVSDILTSGEIVIGEKYVVAELNGDDDFTNAGAVENISGISFVATDTLPERWVHQSVLYHAEPILKTITDIRMAFRDSDNTVVLFLYLGGGITLTNNELITIEDRELDLEGGEYIFDIELTFDDGTIKTYLMGCISITEDITDNAVPDNPTVLYRGFACLQTDSNDWTNYASVGAPVDGTAPRLLMFDRIVNSGNNFTCTNTRVTIESDGFYEINVALSMLSAGLGVCNIHLYKNGSEIRNCKSYNTHIVFDWDCQVMNLIDEFNDGDYFEVFVSRDTNSATTFTITSSSLTIKKISA